MLHIHSRLGATLGLTGMAAALLISTGALADTITGTLNGEPRSWHVVKQGGSSTANFSELVPGMQTVTVQGHVENQFATEGTLSIGFTLINGEMVSPPEATYFHTSGFMPNYGNQDTPQQWELKVGEIEGNTVHVAGHYAGTLKLQGKPTGDEPETMELDVKFDVNAVRTDM